MQIPSPGDGLFLPLLPDLIKMKSHVLLPLREKYHTVSFGRLEVVFNCLLHRNKAGTQGSCVCVGGWGKEM